jgi:hypothetical protein
LHAGACAGLNNLDVWLLVSAATACTLTQNAFRKQFLDVAGACIAVLRDPQHAGLPTASAYVTHLPEVIAMQVEGMLLSAIATAGQWISGAVLPAQVPRPVILDDNFDYLAGLHSQHMCAS